MTAAKRALHSATVAARDRGSGFGAIQRVGCASIFGARVAAGFGIGGGRVCDGSGIGAGAGLGTFGISFTLHFFFGTLPARHRTPASSRVLGIDACDGRSRSSGQSAKTGCHNRSPCWSGSD